MLHDVLNICIAACCYPQPGRLLDPNIATPEQLKALLEDYVKKEDTAKTAKAQRKKKAAS
jgi:hypothetical protein